MKLLKEFVEFFPVLYVDFLLHEFKKNNTAAVPDCG